MPPSSHEQGAIGGVGGDDVATSAPLMVGKSKATSLARIRIRIRMIVSSSHTSSAHHQRRECSVFFCMPQRAQLVQSCPTRHVFGGERAGKGGMGGERVGKGRGRVGKGSGWDYNVALPLCLLHMHGWLTKARRQSAGSGWHCSSGKPSQVKSSQVTCGWHSTSGSGVCRCELGR